MIIDKKSQAAIQVAILITDGRQQDNTLARQAYLAKTEENITIFTIGIGNQKHIKFDELQQVSTAPHQRHAFVADTFDALIETIGNFSWVPRICVEQDACEEAHCHHDCLNVASEKARFTCTCRAGYNLAESDLSSCIKTGVPDPDVVMDEGLKGAKFRIKFPEEQVNWKI